MVIHLLPFELGCNTLPVTRSLPSGLPSPEPVSFASRNAVTVDPECPRLSITIGVGLLAAIVQLLSACAMTMLLAAFSSNIASTSTKKTALHTTHT